ncbi:SRPBCC family protein [Prauserella cavernicola]|uniref:SRPBCC family protein n=1 Tax=Prauserella cavernicola TaxID=2800127 RepID=A0A934V8H0_9PSEU|nr:SRPBCC family protein [Prauserella cavernicola]MBK1787753.1 SRPBCC family protein [Prauserella cavernicola]
MVDVRRTFTVRAPLDTVVDYLSDFANAESWDPGTVSCARLGTGPVEVGSRWRNVSEFRGKETELVYRLTRRERERLTFVGENKTATSTDDVAFAEVDGGTRIDYRASIRFHGLAKLADPFLRREFERLGDELVPTMTAAVERLGS